jgi:hypothetical protein
MCAPIELLIEEADLFKYLNGTSEHQKPLYEEARDFILRYSIIEKALRPALCTHVELFNNKADLSRLVDGSSQSLKPSHGDILSFLVRYGILKKKAIRTRLKPFINETDCVRLFDHPSQSQKPRYDEMLGFTLNHCNLDLVKDAPHRANLKTLENTHVHKPKSRLREDLEPIVPWFYRDKNKKDEETGS